MSIAIKEATVPTIGPSRWRGLVIDRLMTLVVVVLGLVLMQVAARQEWVSPLVLAAPSDIFESLKDGFSGGLYWVHIKSTVVGSMFGFGASAIVAISLAGLLSSSARVERIFAPIIVGFQTLPKIAISPLIILWLGFDLKAKVTIVAVVCFFPMFVNALQGLQLRDRTAYELMSSLGASKWQLFRSLRLPGAVPYIFAGLNVGVVFAVLGAVVAEFVGARDGLGYLLLFEKANYNVPGVYAILVILMFLGLAYHWLIRGLERRIAPWARDVTSAND